MLPSVAHPPTARMGRLKPRTRNIFMRASSCGERHLVLHPGRRRRPLARGAENGHYLRLHELPRRTHPPDGGAGRPFWPFRADPPAPHPPQPRRRRRRGGEALPLAVSLPLAFAASCASRGPRPSPLPSRRRGALYLDPSPLIRVGGGWQRVSSAFNWIAQLPKTRIELK